MKHLLMVAFFVCLFFRGEATAQIAIAGVSHNQTGPDDPVPDCALGSIDVIAQGNAGPFSFNWSNGATTEDIEELCEGTYTVTVTNQFGCTKVLSATVEDCLRKIILPITINANITPLSSPTASDGAISLLVSGGFPTKYYVWTEQATGRVIATTKDISGLKAGTYCVKVTGGCGGSSSACYQIVHCPAINWQISSTTENECDCRGCDFCDKCRKGSIALTVTEPAGVKKYQWSNGATANPLTDLTAGTYAVTVTDVSTGCTQTRSFTITKKTVVVEQVFGCAWRALCDGKEIDRYQGEAERRLEVRMVSGRRQCVEQQYCDGVAVEGALNPLGPPIIELDYDNCKAQEVCKKFFERVVIRTVFGERIVEGENDMCEARITCRVKWDDNTVIDSTTTTINYTYCRWKSCEVWKYCNKPTPDAGFNRTRMQVSSHVPGGNGYDDCLKLDFCPVAEPPNGSVGRHSTSFFVGVSPNPFVTQCRVVFDGVEKGSILQIGVFDLLGSPVHLQKVTAEATSGVADLNFEGQTHLGMYRLIVTDVQTGISYRANLVKIDAP